LSRRIAFPGRAVACTSEAFPDVANDSGADDEVTQYATCLEGVAYVERLAYDTLERLGAGVGDTIHVAGGAARSDVWLQVRADVLYRTLVRPHQPGAAMGAAILAASRLAFGGLIPAARAMVRVERRFEPRSMLGGLYDERYQCFRAACAERGYV
jgi:sugar (pentulose or hexulose) kinase